ncbi:Mannosylfructose-phosphate synthase [Hartmannibacter diazotrophicus]|uniref:Mannosylfructose-phosphate synthase n=1 Tax=Hartmannibacter diazotrophicus TaxID=1482074 RepID=A0A2C9DBK3_9HYPH|nr:MSMEG_0565 family glycosyltransferase [Hartmannibacter diazotrophicus]SON57111.1 Mannosylfructose-phosphate synthase [Hartmannibacter diazotrophicus]
MTAVRPLSVAILAHSTNPRGGVAHALGLGEALTALGHRAVVFAPDASGKGFFRKATCETVPVAASCVRGDLADLVAVRAGDYVAHFEREGTADFDIWHAQDGISANALATLKERGLIPGFARTVHHIDAFEDERLQDLQARAITAADRHFVVSRQWQAVLAEDYGIAATIVGNGVDDQLFNDRMGEADADLRRSLLPPGGPTFLSVGGIEERKNTVRILDAFRIIHASEPSARLVIAGGASLLDHSTYRRRFDAILADANFNDGAVIVTGPVPQRLMAPLYRAADALVFPSVKEGFGLVVLEAMACGTPVVVPHGAPFDEYLGPDDALFCDPLAPEKIMCAMSRALNPAIRERLVRAGHVVACAHAWGTVARAHLAAYQDLMETCDA